MTNLVTDTFLNNAKRLKGFTQGTMNETIHLSKGGLRGMWDTFYDNLRPMLNAGKITDQQFIDALIHYSKYTDDFIKNTINSVGSNTTKESIQMIIQNWRKSNPTSKAISEALKSINL